MSKIRSYSIRLISLCFLVLFSHPLTTMAATGPAGSITNPTTVSDTSFSTVTSLLGTALKNRENSCRVYVKKSNDSVNLDTVLNGAWNAATGYNTSTSNQDTAKLDDYISSIILQHRMLQGIEDSVYYLDYKMQYADTAEEEAAVSESISSILTSLSLSGKTQYQKTKLINDYVRQNITLGYKYDSVSAYDAINGEVDSRTANVLFQRLLRSANIGSRVIKGQYALLNDNNDEYYWVIAKIGSYWYNIDILHDVMLPSGECLNGGFLKNNDAFDTLGFTRDPEYNTESWNSSFVMTSKSYDAGSTVGATCPTKP